MVVKTVVTPVEEGAFVTPGGGGGSETPGGGGAVVTPGVKRELIVVKTGSIKVCRATDARRALECSAARGIDFVVLL